MKSIRDYSEQIDKIKEAIRQADAILIGAGAGLSSSAGFTYSGERFHENFRDFEEKYGFQDMYSGGFYPFSAPEEFWAYWSRYVMINRYANPPKPVYENLLSIVKDKEYFVLTTNVDHCFQKAGFDWKRLFYTQGDYGLFQCSVPCHDQTYDNEEEIRKMYRAQKDRKIPTELIPRCPICGKPMKMNLRADDTFVQDPGWYEALERYERFVRNYRDKKLLLLELGVGGNTPVIIKYPFWNFTLQNADVLYVCVNRGEAVCPREIKARSILIDADIGEVLLKLLSNSKD